MQTAQYLINHRCIYRIVFGRYSSVRMGGLELDGLVAVLSEDFHWGLACRHTKYLDIIGDRLNVLMRLL